MIAKITEQRDQPSLTKAALAKQQGLAISSLYYQPKKPQKDWHLKNQIEEVLRNHPSYGHKRLAIQMGINKKRILRVMKLFSIKPYRRRGRKYKKTKDYSSTYPNLLQQLPFPERSLRIWVSDFTHLSFHGHWVYLATIMDLFDRKIVGWSILSSHHVQLILSALMMAIEKYGRPGIIHSDQGSEYTSRVYTQFTESLGTRVSMSHKGCPWENGYQESFYNQFKVDLGDRNRFKTLAELAVAVYRQIYYYNHLRIHTKLKMPPAIYSQRQSQFTTNSLSPIL